jgi:hypothetical protein
MEQLGLPFWAVCTRPRVLPPNEQAWSAEHALGFTSTDRLRAYLSHRRTGRPRYSLVADKLDLLMLVADLHQEKLSALRMDPDTNGNGGEEIPLADVLKQVE